MNLERYLPRPPLAGLVDYLWHLSDAPAHRRERILPSGTFELVFNLSEDEVRIYDASGELPCRRLSGAVVSGVFSRFFVIDTREHACTIGVHFRPGGAFAFLRRVPAVELRNSHLDLSMLWGSKAPLLRERLRAASTIAQRFQLLEAALLEELRHAGGGHCVVPHALQALAGTSLSVSALAERVQLSHRRLIELFSCEVGATPKVFQRLQRFQQALALARGCSHAASGVPAGGSLGARVAHCAGYCDQSHWIRECVAFSGLTPAQYSSQWGEQVKEHHLAEPVVG